MLAASFYNQSNWKNRQTQTEQGKKDLLCLIPTLYVSLHIEYITPDCFKGDQSSRLLQFNRKFNFKKIIVLNQIRYNVFY